MLPGKAARFAKVPGGRLVSGMMPRKAARPVKGAWACLSPGFLARLQGRLRWNVGPGCCKGRLCMFECRMPRKAARLPRASGHVMLLQKGCRTCKGRGFDGELLRNVTF